MLITFSILSGLLVCTQASGEKNVLKNTSNTRIVNGTDVILGERPFQALLITEKQFCGGAVITQNYVLTAAHCLLKQKPHTVTVYVGAVDTRKSAVIHKASKLVVYEDFPSTVPENDIGLVKVDQSFVFSKTMSPISLMRTGEILPNTSAFVSGWGGTGGPNSKPSPILKKAEIFIVDQKYCADIMFELNMPIFPSNICAFNPTWRRGHCSGDSGGPLTINGELAGIVSWSHKDPNCASTKYPNVYTRVSSFIEWIEKHAV